MTKYFEFLYIASIILLERIAINFVSGNNAYANENNGLVEVPHDIPSYKKLIYLRRNAISAIQQQDFLNLTELTHLVLFRNSIEVFHEFALQYNTKLEHLDVSYNKLAYPPPLSGAEQSIVNLILTDNDIKNISLDYLTNKTRLEVVYLSKNSLTEVNIGKLDSLIKIFMDENELQNMPHLSHILPSLVTLSLGYNNIKFVPHNYFYKTPSLATLSMPYNKLQEFPNLMPINGSLVNLYLDYNNMNISYDNQISMIKLKNLRLHGNYIEISLVDAPELQLVYFSNHGQEKRLTEMPSLLKPLNSLTGLYVQYNWISEISPQYFINTPGLLDLRLAGNDLESFSTAYELDVTILQLQNNKIASFSCEKLKYLSEVRLENNRLTQFPNLTDCAQEITSLQIANNYITYDKAYSEFFFSHQNITNTAPNARFPQMKKLTMSDNAIKHMDSTFFNDCPQLETLEMYRCDLTTFPNISGLIG